MTDYVDTQPPRYTREMVPGGYEYRIAARKNVFALAFLPLWLAGWTAGGVMAISTFMHEFSSFLAVWLIGWAFGWLFAASTILFMLTGREVIRCAGGDLTIGWRMLSLSRVKTYRGSEIRSLAVCDIADSLGRAFAGLQPGGPFAQGRIGTIRFNYGARTQYLAAGLDRAEAEMIVSELLRSIPGGA